MRVLRSINGSIGTCWPQKFYLGSILRFGLTNMSSSRTAHTANMVQDWCQDNFDRFWPKSYWHPSSPDLNVMDYSIWSILASKVRQSTHRSLNSLKVSLQQAWEDLDKETIRRFCNLASEKLKAVVKARGDI